jgi:MoxR-like ATPase
VAFRSRIRRVDGGAVRLDLDEDERAVLLGIGEELGALLEEEPDDPSLRRLYPSAHEDERLEQEFRELTRSQLATGRQRALETLRQTVGNELLSPEQADAWLRALNDARLVLGTRLDVTEDYDWEALDANTPRAPELALYAYLSWLQEQLVEATCSTM